MIMLHVIDWWIYFVIISVIFIPNKQLGTWFQFKIKRGTTVNQQIEQHP